MRRTPSTIPVLLLLLGSAVSTVPAKAALGDPATGLPDTTATPIDSLEYPDPQEDTWDLFGFPAWVGVGFSGGFCATGNYESMVGGAITYGKLMGENGWVELSVGYTATPLQQSSSLRETINSSPGMFSIAVAARAFLSPQDRSVRYHLLFGMGVDFLLWTYNTPINTANDEGSVDYVSDDSLPGLDFHLGLGFTMFRESGMVVTAEVTPGLKLWFDTTRNGFSNDLFSSYGFMVLKVQAAFEIGR